MTQTRRALLRHEVIDQIKAYILENHLRPGDPLPSEAELGETLNASRSSLREAVKTLAALDIVEVRHGSGSFVGRLSLSALVESLAFRSRLNVQDDVRALLDLVDVRQVLELGMADRIVAGLDACRLDELDRLVDRYERAASDEALMATDGTARPRPDGADLRATIHAVHDKGGLVMADVSTREEGVAAAEAGADLIATTLSGYTPYSRQADGPDLDLVRELAAELSTVPVIAEGRYHHPEQVAAALDAGARAVVVGTAITDPVFITAAFARAAGAA